jgi:hypothetical protein
LLGSGGYFLSGSLATGRDPPRLNTLAARGAMGACCENQGLQGGSERLWKNINAFVDRQNLLRLRNQLENGVKSGSARSLLLDLFVEQEKRFSMGQEQLERVDRHIGRLRQIIAGQVQLVDRLRAMGLPSDGAKVVLDTLNDMKLVHYSFRETVIATHSINRELADSRRGAT